MLRYSLTIKRFIGFLMLFSAAALLAGDEKTDKVDKIFAKWDETTTPGVALAVIQDGKIIYERGYGPAKLQKAFNIAMTGARIVDGTGNPWFFWLQSSYCKKRRINKDTVAEVVRSALRINA